MLELLHADTVRWSVFIFGPGPSICGSNIMFSVMAFRGSDRNDVGCVSSGDDVGNLSMACYISLAGFLQLSVGDHLWC